MKLPTAICYLTVAAILIANLADTVEARRTILRGRKTVTRTYMRDNAVPAWGIVLLVGVGELVAGGVFYFIMKKMILDVPLTGNYAVNNPIEP